jgi:hypothetical protein
MVGLLNKFQKLFKRLSDAISPPVYDGPMLNPFAKAPPYQDKFRDLLDKIKPVASVISTAAGFIPVVGTAVSAGISGAMTAAEMGDKIYELSQSKNWDWSNLYDWEKLANDPEQLQTLMDVMGGTYNGDPAPINSSYGNFSGNFHY